MSDLTIALAGGAVGAVVAGVGRAVALAWAAWAGVGEHDRQADELNMQLKMWVDERTRATERVMRERINLAGERLYSSATANALVAAKEDALQDYRDKLWNLRAALGGLAAQEGAWHWLWRRLRHRADGLALTADEEVQPFLDRWREPVTSHQGEPQVPFDRTRWSYQEALDGLPQAKLT